MRTSLIKKVATAAFGLMLPICVMGSSDIGKAPDRGYAIQTSTENGVPQKSGQSAILSGDISLVGKAIGTATGPHQSFDAYLQEDGVQVRFFFPDMTREVTSGVSFTPLKNKLKFKYNTGNLQVSDLNSLHVLVTRMSSGSQGLLKIQSKLELRIAELNALVGSLSGKKPDEQDLAQIEKYRDRLRAIADRLSLKLAQKNETLAEARHALLVDNRISQSSMNAMVMGKFRVQIDSSLGSAIQGQETELTGSILNLRNPGESTAEGLRLARFFWNGNLVKEIGPEPITNGGQVRFTYNTGKLLVANANMFSVELFNWDQESAEFEKRVANLSLREPVAADSIAPKWLAGSTPDNDHPYVKNAQNVSAKVMDEFGRVDPSSTQATLSGALTDGSSYGSNVTSALQIVSTDQGQSYEISGDLNPLSEGEYTLRLEAKDVAENAALPNPHSSSFRIDRTAPQITLGVADHYLTNNSAWSIPVAVVDHSPAETVVIQNGVEIARSSDLAFNVPVILNEMLNVFEVSSTDAAGNVSSTSLIDIVLDTTPPVLSNLHPAKDSILSTLTFVASGSSNEPLLEAKLNGQSSTLGETRRSFSSQFTALTEGPQQLTWEIFDLAGNKTSETIPVRVDLRVLNSTLISVAPDQDGVHFLIQGAPGAANPFVGSIPIKAAANFLNSGTAQSNPDGSFSIKLLAFQEALISATHPVTGKDESVKVRFEISNTVLSGIVKDSIGNPLPSVTVSIAGSPFTSITDASGSFSLAQDPAHPITGDRMLIVDGTTVPNAPAPAPQRRFSRVNISVAIRLNRNNLLRRPIYLTAIPAETPSYDNTNQSVQVSAVNDPSVRLEIPGSAAVFPDGKQEGQIYLERISTDAATIAPPSYSVPDSVITLEPSGLTFKERVQVILPNENDLPPGVALVIMSMNPQKGIWEIDGLADVTSDGRSVVTRPGLGISHFSTIYASPLGPKPRAMGSQDKPGADLFNGANKARIDLPSVQIMGSAIRPSLVYNSAWAKPTALVTNLFDIPREDVSVGGSDSKGLGTLARVTVDQDYRAWYQPDFITAQFRMSGITTPTYKFAAKEGEDFPQKSVISYAVELKDQNTGEYKSSQIYPWTSKYEIHLKHISVTTTTKREWSFWGDPEISVDVHRESKALEDAFPADLTGLIYLQNYRESAIGRGWRLAGLQKIVNPESDRIFLEEADGSISGYAINNSISTVYNAGVKEFDLSGAAYIDGAAAFFTGRNGGGPGKAIYRFDFSKGTAPEFIGSIPDLSGSIVGNNAYNLPIDIAVFRHPTLCEKLFYPFTVISELKQLFPISASHALVADFARSAIYQVGMGQAAVLAGHLNGANTINRFDLASAPLHDQVFGYCSSHALSCSLWFGLGGIKANPGHPDPHWFCRNNGDVNGPYNVDGSGPVPHHGFADGAFGEAHFQKPWGIAAGPRPNTIVVADRGNYLVRLLDLTTGTVETIAGNRSFTSNTGDGKKATEAGIYHPQGLVYDAAGNLYISTENGAVRKVDTSGIISTLVGAPGAQEGESGYGPDILLNRPFGMAVDNELGYLYIADTGNHWVRRLDLNTLRITTVAGNKTQGAGPDGVPALASSLSEPTMVAVDPDHNLLIVDSGTDRIRRVSFQNFEGGPVSFGPIARDNSKLYRLSDGTWIREYRNKNKEYFDISGLHVASVDRIGRTTQFLYERPAADSSDASRVLTEIRPPVGNSILYSYRSGRLDTITDPAGRVTRFGYESDGDLESVIFPDNTRRGFEYDADGLLASETNERQIATEYKYNDWGRLERVTRGLGTPDQTVTLISDTGSMTVAKSFDGQAGQPISVRLASNKVENSGKVTSFKLDENGFISVIEGPDGKKTKVERNLFGQPTKVLRKFVENDPENPNDDSWESELTYTYDTNTGDLLSQVDSKTGITTTQKYDELGNVSEQTNARGKKSYRVFDLATDLLMSETDPLGRTKEYQYSNGFVTKVSQKVGGAEVSHISYTPDSLGNVKAEIDALGNVKTFHRDEFGNVDQITVSNPDGTEKRETVYSYDDMNRLVSVRTPRNETTVYRYSPTGKLIQIEDPEFVNDPTRKIVFSYDALDRVVQKTDQLGFITAFKFDALGNVAEEVDPNGNVKQFRYDDYGRLRSKLLPDGNYDFNYDDDGHLLTASNSVSIISNTYDDLGRLTSTQTQGLGLLSSLPQVTIGYEYDLNGNRTLMSDSVGGSVTYTYDDGDRLNQLVNQRGDAFALIYNDVARKMRLERSGSLSGGVITVASVDPTGFLTDLTHSSGGSVISGFSYGRDYLGNRTSVDIGGGRRYLFGYDLNNQLQSATNPETGSIFSDETFTFDSIGNRVTDHRGSHQAYDSKKQRLISDYFNFYYYDNNGNLTKKQAREGFPYSEVTNYSYSSENQLLGFQVYKAGSVTPFKEVKYAYDAAGRRIQKVIVDQDATLDRSKTFTRRYVYDSQEVLLEYDEYSLLARYTHSGLRTDDVLGVEVTQSGVEARLASASGTYQYLKDAQGTVVDVLDGSGQRIQHYVYSVFGILLGIQDAQAADVTANPPLATSYGFTGRELDRESGLMYYRARHYDPGTGRFLQKDPHPGKLEIPGTVVNSYAYVLNNAANYTDPSGKFIPALIAGIAALGTLIAGGAGVGSALLAVGSVLGGSIVAAAIQSAVTGKWGADFWSNVGTNFTIGAGLLAVGGLIGIASGGSLAAGGNGLHGYVHTTKSFLLGGDTLYNALTLGSAHFGQGAFSSTLLAHEFGHTLQFLALSALPIGNEGVWGAYLGLGALGLTPLGTWWEANGSFLGGANTCINCSRYGLFSAAY